MTDANQPLEKTAVPVNFLFRFETETGFMGITDTGKFLCGGNFDPDEAAQAMFLTLVDNIYPLLPVVLGRTQERAEKLFQRINVLAGLSESREALRANVLTAIGEEIAAAEIRGAQFARMEKADTSVKN